VLCLCAEDGLLRPKRERRSRERSHRSRSRDRKRSRRSRSRGERRGGSKSRSDRRRDAAEQNGQVFVKQEVEDVAAEYGAPAGADNNYYNQHAGGIDPANY